MTEIADIAEMEVNPVEPDEVPTSAVGRSSPLLVGGGIAVSVVAHLMLGGVVLFASPKLLATVPEHSMMVDLVTPKEFEEASKGEKTEPATDIGAAPTQTEPQAKTGPQSTTAPTTQPQRFEQKMEQKSFVPPPLFSSPQAMSPPSPPLPQPIDQKVSEHGEALPPPDSRPADEAPEKLAKTEGPKTEGPKTEGPKTEGPKTEGPKTEGAPADAGTLVEMLRLPVQIAGADAPPSETAAQLSAEEIAGFKDHLKKCWVPPSGVPDTKKLKAVIRVALNPDGTLIAKPALLAASASEFGPALVESAMRALVQCQPYTVLPAEKYKEWKFLDLNFSQDDIAGVIAPPSDGRVAPKG
jgi:hypothetical protein